MGADAATNIAKTSNKPWALPTFLRLMADVTPVRPSSKVAVSAKLARAIDDEKMSVQRTSRTEIAAHAFEHDLLD